MSNVLVLCAAAIILTIIIGTIFLSYHHLDHHRRVKAMDMSAEQKKEEFEFIKNILPEQAAQHLLTGEAKPPPAKVEQSRTPRVDYR